MSERRHERVLRGIPRWLLRQYLEELGGQAVPPGEAPPDVAEETLVTGDGWQARLTQLEDFRIGSLRSGQVRFAVTGQAASVDALLAALAPRLLRGGG